MKKQTNKYTTNRNIHTKYIKSAISLAVAGLFILSSTGCSLSQDNSVELIHSHKQVVSDIKSKYVKVLSSQKNTKSINVARNILEQYEESLELATYLSADKYHSKADEEFLLQYLNNLANKCSVKDNNLNVDYEIGTPDDSTTDSTNRILKISLNYSETDLSESNTVSKVADKKVELDSNTFSIVQYSDTDSGLFSEYKATLDMQKLNENFYKSELDSINSYIKIKLDKELDYQKQLAEVLNLCYSLDNLFLNITTDKSKTLTELQEKAEKIKEKSSNYTLDFSVDNYESFSTATVKFSDSENIYILHKYKIGK